MTVEGEGYAAEFKLLQKKIRKVQKILVKIENEQGTKNKLYRAYTRKLDDYNNRINETEELEDEFLKADLDVEEKDDGVDVRVSMSSKLGNKPDDASSISSAKTGELSFDDPDDLMSRGDDDLSDAESTGDMSLDSAGDIEIDTSAMEIPEEVADDDGKKKKGKKKKAKGDGLSYKALQKKIKKLKKTMKALEKEHGKKDAKKRDDYKECLADKKKYQAQLEETPEYMKDLGIESAPKKDEDFPENGVWLRIIQINDVYELDNFPNFKTLCDTKAKETKNGHKPGEFLIILSGDFVAPSLLSGLDKGRGMIDTMNKCGITHVCFGNHECDIPNPDLAKRIQESEFAWINTNMRDIDEILKVKTDPHDVIKVKSADGSVEKKVGLLGLLTEDPSVYRPGAFGGAVIEPILECTKKYMKDVMDPLNLDLVVPLTHQRMDPDREFSKTFKGDVFPIVVGAHDHEPYDETYEGSRIVKTGMDGHNTAIIDIIWDASKGDKPKVDVDMVTTPSYMPDRTILKVVQGHKRILHELKAARLFKLSNWLKGGDTVFSTKDNRLGPSSGSKVLCSMFRMGMRADCCICNSGAIRAGKVYPKEQEWFSWSDLKAEVPFPTELTTVYIPGIVLQETIKYSRRLALQTPPSSSGGYLQHCDHIEMDEIKCEIHKICGEDFDPDRKYLLALPIDALRGIDNHVPLIEWAEKHHGTGVSSANDEGRPAKIIMVETFSAMMWLDMGSFSEIDTNGDGVLTPDEVRDRAVIVFGEAVADMVVQNVFSVADVNGNGYITPVDMMVINYAATDMVNRVGTEDQIGAMQEVAADVLGKRASSIEVQDMMKLMMHKLDEDESGDIDREEVMKVVGTLHRQSLLH
mmetsp:Transcript_32496/g.78886  ORF Transcript_32496/g.78886 Transcript_32496/m.78886 type:complete len:864 (-) Transcript_32496:184-2775(-)|eukprot:CAMPEP_0113625004 /NCGR_PEP_ID=MMETSP0017_2-20120614/12905_1 /TAXON_ID=2856 /ORGANISM="Cylindrotheca closterium" /LENGTH=863 /DNA_ID=CAMNT_0000535083 /DNA_START=111 /DNA_END=2702 /DNA_ORIENTATION=- /assembly_acc=CAM_ASM_000147